MSSFSNQTALISVVGPSGIAAAVILHQMGWKKLAGRERILAQDRAE